MERAELALELELALGIQPKVQESATHHQEKHILALDDGHTSLTERVQRKYHDCQDREGRRQRPRHHVYGQFIDKSRLSWCYFCFFLHSHPERLSAQSLCQKNSRYIFRASPCIRRRAVK